MHAAHILSLLLVCTIGGSQNPVQLSYYFYEGNLVLQCEVLNPYLSVFIVDFNDREQGHCRPIPVPKCFNYFKSETKLSFNNITNVTTFIKGASDMSKIIGKWTCKHGSGEGNPSSTIYVTMRIVSGEPVDNKAKTDTCTYLSYVAVVIGCLPATKSLFCKVVRKIIECTGTSYLCNNNNFIEWIFLKIVGMIPECGLQPEKKRNIIVIGIKLILCLVLVSFPYLTVGIINQYYFRKTKDQPTTWTGVYVFLIIEGSIIGIVCKKILLISGENKEVITTEQRETLRKNEDDNETTESIDEADDNLARSDV